MHSAAGFSRIPCVASSLVGPVLDGGPRELPELVRTAVSAHYATGLPAVPVLTVGTRAAVRLPASVVTDVVPRGPLAAGDGVLSTADATWRAARWWHPPRPRGLPLPARDDVERCAAVLMSRSRDGVPTLAASSDALVPDRLVGAGPGLTPAGDDVLAGALVTAHAVDDPRLPRWRRETTETLARQRTTAVSEGLLRAALEGYATEELARLLTALCRGEDLRAPLPRLLALGHSSGTALLTGVLHTVRTAGDGPGLLRSRSWEG